MAGKISRAFSGSKRSRASMFTVAKLLPLLLLIALGLPQVRVDVLAAHAVEHPDWREAVLLMVFAYGGFESMVIAASETRDPRRDTGPALIAAGAIVTLIYCLLQLVIVGVLPDAGRTTTPMASALREILGPVGATLGSIAVILSVYGWLTGFTLMMPRVLYSMATHGELPINPRPRASPLPDAARRDRRECHPGAGHGSVQLVRASRHVCRDRTTDGVRVHVRCADRAEASAAGRHQRFSCREARPSPSAAWRSRCGCSPHGARPSSGFCSPSSPSARCLRQDGARYRMAAGQDGSASRVLERTAGIEEHDAIARANRAVGHEPSNRRQRRSAFGRGADPFRAAELEHAIDHRRVRDGDCRSAALAHRSQNQEVADRTRDAKAVGDGGRVLPRRRVLGCRARTRERSARIRPPAPTPSAAAGRETPSRDARSPRTPSTSPPFRCRRRWDTQSSQATPIPSARPARRPSSSCPRCGTAP